MQQLHGLAELQDDWDGYGSLPISAALREEAAHLLLSMANPKLPVPSIGPESGGCIQVAWNRGTRGLELHLQPDGHARYLLDKGDETYDEGIVRTDDLASLSGLVVRFMDDQ
jgi:hypothetical protein